METKISVIIPALNEEKYLPTLLEDLTQQSDKRFEVIIIDGKSKDTTREKALAFQDRLSLQFIVSPRANPAFQRNLGAEKAKSPYLFFVDADTELSSDIIQKLLKHIEEEKGLLYLPVLKPNNPTRTNRFLVGITVRTVKVLGALNMPLSIGSLIVIKKTFFENIGRFSELASASEDHNLIIKADKAGYTAKFLNDVICTISMRRFDSQGAWKISWQYIVFTIETILKGGVYKTSIDYEMGGQRYNQKFEK